MLRVDSRKVMSGDTFLALIDPYTDGHDYIQEAIDKGAACIIASHGEYSVKTILVEDTRTYLANYLKELYLEKLNKIKLIGIVGTTGKTVTGNLIYQLLNNLNSKTACITTNGFYIDEKVEKISSSTPDLYELYELINKAIDNECENIVIEISSKAMKQRHLEGLKFDIAIFTNFIAHQRKDREDYLNTKVELFKMLKRSGIAIINKKDANYENFTLPQNKNILYGSLDSDYPIRKINANYNYTEFSINKNIIKIKLIGTNNILNYAPAYITAITLGYDEESIASATLTIHQVDGRFEGMEYKDNLIIIDYAYDLDTISSVLKEAKELAQGKIITIIGCGGERREEKRPLIGKLVTENSDLAIFTTDNPRHEDENKIIEDITKDIEKNNYIKLPNRKEAIKKGINMLENKDILLILGKGHEDTQIIGSDEFPFKDKDEVLKIIK